MYEKFEVSINELHPHQKEYYNALCKMKEEKENFHSIVCIPTGGGKTRLAITYAINKELNEGKRILWIAHSHYLLDQAYDAFRALASKELSWENMLMIYHLDSGEDSINRDLFLEGKNVVEARHVSNFFFSHKEQYKIVIASFQSILSEIRKYSCSNPLEKIFGSNICVIVDEVHHLGAPVYYELLKDYVKDKTLIGLSATPERTDGAGNYWLGQMFPDDLGVTVNMADLIAKGFLVRPIFEEVYFGSNDEDIDSNTGEAVYNNAIYQRYVKNQEKYGKTVIFAMSILHADTLYELFSADDNLSIKVFLVHSKSKNRVQQFSDFKKSKDGILINVNVMNEGVDIPDVTTVFFTKQMESRIIVTQCIGRALRTCKEKEKKVAYVVNFAVSNIGDKLYLASPKIAYELYKMDFCGRNCGNYVKEVFHSQLQMLKDLQKMINSRYSNVSVSASEVLLAGHYNLEFEGNSFLLPVTYSEYLAIEEYRKNPIETKLPMSYFFAQQIRVKEKIMKAVKEGTCVFIVYDNSNNNALMSSFHKLQENVTSLYKKYLYKGSDIYTSYDVKKEIHTVFENIKNNDVAMWDHLHSIGVDTEGKFSLLIWNQFVDLKYEYGNQTDIDSGIVDFSDEGWIDIEEVKTLKQYLGIGKWLKSYPYTFTAEASKTIGAVSDRVYDGILGFKGTTGNFYWDDILNKEITRVYEEVIKEVVPGLKCCTNSEAREQIEEGLRGIAHKIYKGIGWNVNDDKSYIGKILYSQLVGKKSYKTWGEWLDAAYDFSSIDQKSKNKIQNLVDYLFDKSFIEIDCCNYNLNIFGIKIWRTYVKGKKLIYLEKALQWYYNNMHSKITVEQKKCFEKGFNKFLFINSQL